MEINMCATENMAQKLYNIHVCNRKYGTKTIQYPDHSNSCS